MFEVISIHQESDIFLACRRVRHIAQEQALGKILTEQLTTAVCEIARNQLIHARAGMIRVTALEAGVLIEAHDRGPGISNLDQAMSDGWSSAGGLGLGLPSARDLVHEFEIQSSPGQGTLVRLTQWRQAPPGYPSATFPVS